ncbi:PaaI family thioesterase [Pseudaestuariivita rosea]|uniref:PaaI family thioesterase n=1 Tax=Pseudaestuariivita rosea TaxID=2763263 RepID=UPI001F300871|nr:PaaI family thioesterase [Pseudaestuariivita rosea]
MMNKAGLTAFLQKSFPQVADDFQIDTVLETELSVCLTPQDRHLRPGGTVSGPTLFGLADVSIYLAILSRIGPKALAVTTNCSIDFMRKPAADRDLIAVARLLKLGRVLAVGDTMIYSDGMPDPVARATLTYSIPPKQA